MKKLLTALRRLLHPPGWALLLTPTVFSAIYTFYAMGISIANLIKYLKLGSPVLSAAKVLNLVSAMMSVLGLQTAMIAQFSANGDDFRQTMNAVVGGCVWISVILTAACMLHRSKRMENEVKPVEQIRK